MGADYEKSRTMALIQLLSEDSPQLHHKQFQHKIVSPLLGYKRDRSRIDRASRKARRLEHLQQRIEQFDRAKEAKFLSMSDEPTLLQKGIVLVMAAIFNTRSKKQLTIKGARPEKKTERSTDKPPSNKKSREITSQTATRGALNIKDDEVEAPRVGTLFSIPRVPSPQCKNLGI